MTTSLFVLAAGLSAVVLAEVNWQRAVNAATATGLVACSSGEVTSVP